ncbi:MAG TPA: amidohydrolase family protein [Bryobacteraceae bacterium]|nr:amidohydrolase family protein [Bryobacteraceae bacterium]
MGHFITSAGDGAHLHAKESDRHHHAPGLFRGCAAIVLLLVHASCTRTSSHGVDPQVAQQIAAIKAIDNHAHPPLPDPADRDFDALPVEMLEAQTDPVRLRPPGQPGLKPTLKLSPAETLDRAGIDRVIANRVSMGPGLPPERFLWVAYADALMYPFATAVLDINPDRTAFFALEAKLLERYYQESGVAARPASLEDYLARVVLATIRRHKQGGAIGEKFEMAYLRPLEIGNPSRAEAEAAWRDGGRTGAAYRKLQDFIFRAIAAECGSLGMAVHFHTGDGSGSYFDFQGANPLLLQALYNDPSLRKTNFVMVHGGWPFTREAGALLEKPNAYLDFSMQQFLRAPSDLAQTIRAWLELTPEKVMFGTDAYPYAPDAGLGWSETTLMASQAGREALGLALTDMVREGTASRERAGELAAMVLRENARKLYGLK